MATLDFGVNYAGTSPDEQDRRAMTWLIEQENIGRASLVPPLAPLLTTPASTRNQNYQDLMAAKARAIHREHISQAVEQYNVKDLVARLRLANEATLASVAALLPQLP